MRVLSLLVLALVIGACESTPTESSPAEPMRPSFDHITVTTNCANHGTRGDGAVSAVETSPARDTLWTSPWPYNIGTVVAAVYRDDPWTGGIQHFCRDYDVTVPFTFPDPYVRYTYSTPNPQGTWIQGVSVNGTGGSGLVIAWFGGKADTTVVLVKNTPHP